MSNDFEVHPVGTAERLQKLSPLCGATTPLYRKGEKCILPEGHVGAHHRGNPAHVLSTEHLKEFISVAGDGMRHLNELVAQVGVAIANLKVERNAWRNAALYAQGLVCSCSKPHAPSECHRPYLDTLIEVAESFTTNKVSEPDEEAINAARNTVDRNILLRRRYDNVVELLQEVFRSAGVEFSDNLLNRITVALAEHRAAFTKEG